MANERDITGELILIFQHIEELELKLTADQLREMQTDIDTAKTSYRLNRDHALYDNPYNPPKLKQALHDHGVTYVDTMKQIVEIYTPSTPKEINTGTRVKISDAHLEMCARTLGMGDKSAGDTGTVIEVIKGVFCHIQFSTEKRYIHKNNLTVIE